MRFRKSLHRLVALVELQVELRDTDQKRALLRGATNLPRAVSQERGQLLRLPRQVVDVLQGIEGPGVVGLQPQRFLVRLGCPGAAVQPLPVDGADLQQKLDTPRRGAGLFHEPIQRPKPVMPVEGVGLPGIHRRGHGPAANALHLGNGLPGVRRREFPQRVIEVGRSQGGILGSRIVFSRRPAALQQVHGRGDLLARGLAPRDLLLRGHTTSQGADGRGRVLLVPDTTPDPVSERGRLGSGKRFPEDIPGDVPGRQVARRARLFHFVRGRVADRKVHGGGVRHARRWVAPELVHERGHLVVGRLAVPGRAQGREGILAVEPGGDAPIPFGHTRLRIHLGEPGPGAVILGHEYLNLTSTAAQWRFFAALPVGSGVTSHAPGARAMPRGASHASGLPAGLGKQLAAGHHGRPERLPGLPRDHLALHDEQVKHRSVLQALEVPLPLGDDHVRALELPPKLG